MRVSLQTALGLIAVAACLMAMATSRSLTLMLLVQSIAWIIVPIGIVCAVFRIHRSFWLPCAVTITLILGMHWLADYRPADFGNTVDVPFRMLFALFHDNLTFSVETDGGLGINLDTMTSTDDLQRLYDTVFKLANSFANASVSVVAVFLGIQIGLLALRQTDTKNRETDHALDRSTA